MTARVHRSGTAAASSAQWRAIRRGELLWEFDAAAGRFRVELQTHAPWGVEAVFFLDEQFFRCRRLYNRELAMQWAERERADLTRHSFRKTTVAMFEPLERPNAEAAAAVTTAAAAAASDARPLDDHWARLVGAVREAHDALLRSRESAAQPEAHGHFITRSAPMPAGEAIGPACSAEAFTLR